MNKVRWGILGTAKIAREWMIPAIKKSPHAKVAAIASRDGVRADAIALEMDIPLALGSYEELTNCSEVDAIYVSLPNHLHVPWSTIAIKAGKHVLCEKPIGLNSEEARNLVVAANASPQLLVMEAFMYRYHPQWLRVQDLIDAGELGEIRHVQASFTYHNTDPDNVRNQAGIGGGGLMDIGCYCISAARHVFGKEPERVIGHLDWDPEFETDRHASGLLDFGSGMATFHCSTQSNSSQMVKIIGDRGTVLVINPFFNREEEPSRLIVYRDNVSEVITIGNHNHYVSQVDAFSRAVLNGQAAPTPLSDALANMKVIDAVFASARAGAWVADLDKGPISECR